jgi:hypothetical protein
VLEAPQRLAEGCRPRRRILAHEPGDHAVDARRQTRPVRRRRRRLVVHLPHQDRHVVIAVDRVAPGEHHVRQHAERVRIGPVIDVAAVALLRRHVARRSHRRAAPRLVHERVVRIEQLRDPEVEQLGKDTVGVRREEHVLGLEVAVRDPLGVRRVQRAGKRPQDRERLAERQVALARDPAVEGLAVEVLHHIVVAAVVERPEREDVDDVVVADLVDRARLGHEPRHHLRIDREPLRQHLDRDQLADQRVHRLEHRTEAALPQLGLDPVLADDLAGLEVRIDPAAARDRWCDRGIDHQAPLSKRIARGSTTLACHMISDCCRM